MRFANNVYSLHSCSYVGKVVPCLLWASDFREKHANFEAFVHVDCRQINHEDYFLRIDLRG